MADVKVEVSPELWAAILVLFQTVLNRVWNDVKGKSQEEILEMAKAEEAKSESLQQRQEGWPGSPS